MNEADTCRRFVVPKLQSAGWGAEPHRISEQVTFTDGRIVVAGRKARRRPGKRGAGLLAYLRGLAGRGDNGAARRRRVIATVFNDVNCRMLSGYLLRDVLNKVDRIHFLAKEELFTLGHLYESMLREMRDAAGENGELGGRRIFIDVRQPSATS